MKVVDNWDNIPLIKQLALIGREITLAIQNKNSGNQNAAVKAYKNSLELFELTIRSHHNQYRLKEVVMACKYWTDYFNGINEFKFTDAWWIKYFSDFEYAASRYNTQ